MVKRIALSSFLFLFLSAGVFMTSGLKAYADESITGKKPTATATPKKKSSSKKSATPTKTATPTKKVDMPPLYIADAKGDVFLVHKGDKKKADPPQKVEADDRIVTGDNGKAYLQFESGGTIEVGPKSDVKVSQLNVSKDTFKARFQVAFGKMKTAIHKLTSSTSTFEVEAGGVVSGVRGTVFEVAYDKDKKQESTKTYEGTVATTANGKETLVEKGMGLVVAQGGKTVLNALGGSDVADFVQFLDAKDKLDAAKDILMKKLEQKLIEEAAKKLLGQKGDDLIKGIQFHF